MKSDSTKSPETIRVLFLGGPRVGKTSIIQRLLGENFKPQYTPTVYDVYKKTVHQVHSSLHLEFIDTSGLYSCPPMMKLAISKADIMIFMYSATDPSSVKEMNHLRAMVNEVRGHVSMDTPMAVIANKVDDSRENLNLAFRKRCESLQGSFEGRGTTFMATSAKYTYGLRDLMDYLMVEAEMVTRLREIPFGNVTRSYRWIDANETFQENAEVFENIPNDTAASLKNHSGVMSFLRKMFCCVRPKTASDSVHFWEKSTAKRKDSYIQRKVCVTKCRVYIEVECLDLEKPDRAHAHRVG